ncbi:hypothetical protein [Actinoplanes sp. NPDC026619]|uniref:hypothetical protein n=1 Tax=Actinoplanes sp. NPDC026619 TaxID=3155798 RepID=UPI0033DA63C1
MIHPGVRGDGKPDVREAPDDGGYPVSPPPVRAAPRATRDSAGLLQQAFKRLREAGEVTAGDDALRTRLVIGALCEAAATMADSSTPEQALTMARTDVGRFLKGLRAH